jgi:outer membrane protein assembly factor BamB/tetratricopeptide (TPR) repeat protein
MLSLRRFAACLGLGIVALALVSLLADRGAGQVAKVKKGPPLPPDPNPSGGSAAGLSSVKIMEDSRFRKVINVGRDCIKDKEWNQAVEALQTVLDEKKDYYVQILDTDAFGKETTPRWTSVKFEANNLIGSMDLEGLDVYEQKHGGDAKIILDEAKSKGDRDLLAEVAHRYCHTIAGIEANEIEATLYLARGQVFASALRFEKLLQMKPERTKLSDMTLYKAALAFHRAGDKKNHDATWERLRPHLESKGGLKIGEDMVPMAKLAEVFKETPIVDVVNVHDWPSWRGNVRNSAQASGSPPLLDTRLWRRPVFKDKLDGFNDEDPDQPALDRVQKAIDQVNNANLPVLPGFFPIASQGIMVYRSPRDVRAVALREIEARDEESGIVNKIKPGQLVWKSIPHNRSLAVMLEKNNTRVKVEQWMASYDQVPGFNSFLYDNSLIGTLVTDHRYVYAINDLAVPPHPSVFIQNPFNPQLNQFNPGDVKPLITQNELVAYDLVNGKMKWDLNQDDRDFKDSHFISLPISVGGKLYVLNEKLPESNQPNQPNPFGGGMVNPFPGESELRLVCIDPNKLIQTNTSPKPDVVKIQPIGNIVQQNRMVQDIGRRVNAIQLAYDEGVLVCPTNAGEVFGIDLMTRSLVWSYPYRENPHQHIHLPGMPIQPQPFPQKNIGTTVVSKWKSSPPAIQDGKVVFTAPDSDSVHCVSVRDGRPVWKKAQQKGDLYMAGVYQGRVLVVSDTSIRALDVKDGRQMWSIHTGDMPSGQGVASKGMYYLPLKKGEILAVDIVKGEIKAHNRAAVEGAAPGNLVFYENMVLSQTPTEVAAYPQLSARLDAAKIDSAKDPENIAKLADYGELLLKDGQVHLAVETLLKAYNQNPANALGKRVKDRLFEAMTDLLQIDFKKADKDYLTTYKALCNIPDNAQEEQARKAKFFRLVGQGREAQGNLVEAFQMYKEFGALPIHQNQGGIASTEDPHYKIPVNVWLRGRISGMLAKASKEEREPLEASIAEEWKTVEAKKDIDAIRSFVAMFDIPVRVGREARVKLAETIMERNQRAAFLEAEMLLHQVLGSDFHTEPQTGGRALAALAQLEEKKGTIDSTRLAAAYYRQLNRDFAKDPVRGTKTGADLVNELATDKRFLPFLEESSNPFGPVKLTARELGAGAFNVGLPGFVMMPQGDQTPFAKQNRLMLDPSDTVNPRVRLRDGVTNQDRWTTNLGRVEMNQQVYFHMYQQSNINQAYHPNARFRFYQVKGHLIVCQVGVMVYCLDGDTGKKLWEMQTVENIPQNGMMFLQQVMNDSEGNPEFLYRNNQTQQIFRVTLGRIGAVQASYVAVLGHKGLKVLDPLRGTVLWKRDDASITSHVFGDEQYLFMAEANQNGGFGAGITFRASDGEVLKKVPDFSNVYQARIRTVGRQILAAQTAGGNLNVHLYDILQGKDVWSKAFPQGSQVLHTEDRNITGVLEPNGKLTVLDADTGREIVTSNLVQGRVTPEDVRGLKDALLLQDAERFYVALNKPIEPNRVGGGLLHNNFNNGTRCLNVNGWFVAVHRQDGQKKVADREITWKKGDLAWHSYMPVQNQMIIVDQFDQSPVVLFTARYNQLHPNGGNGWVSATQSLHKATGKMVYEATRPINGASPMFASFQLDLKSRTINLIGFSGSVQHYVDDGKAPPPPQGAMLHPGHLDGTSSTLLLREHRVDPGLMPGGGFRPGERVMRRPVWIDDEIQILPLPELPPIDLPKR